MEEEKWVLNEENEVKWVEMVVVSLLPYFLVVHGAWETPSISDERHKFYFLAVGFCFEFLRLKYVFGVFLNLFDGIMPFCLRLCCLSK